jgi:hypothetical protein
MQKRLDFLKLDGPFDVALTQIKFLKPFLSVLKERVSKALLPAGELPKSISGNSFLGVPVKQEKPVRK